MIKYLLFLLWHDGKMQPITKYMLITTASLLGAIWAFPLDNISPQGFMSPEQKFHIRMYSAIIIVLVTLSAFIILSMMRYKKYSKPEVLSDEELEDALHHLNKNS